ncbi:hypothetical protein CLOSTMETH_03456 [[Clostridium] methylpentosum DSM 5476]|uniref:Uncharacterized protein n=1 Tax=[Clostridium] methylpentosum DSM 5476 TaxID=537013 RepID=C0EHW1_9FIRM|nr:hypothetical protein CLOSTMETH_03456 [[Clostridium] methylpentosum DSM 5476]
MKDKRAPLQQRRPFVLSFCAGAQMDFSHLMPVWWGFKFKRTFLSWEGYL